MNTPYVYPVRTIVKIIDGDSVRVEIDRGWGDYSRRDVRILGVDAPELRTKAGALVRGAVLWWMMPQTAIGQLMLESIELDKYGRTLGDFYFDGDDPCRLSEYLLGESLVRPYRGDVREPWCEEELSRICFRADGLLGGDEGL